MNENDSRLTHLDDNGAARMVDVGGKPATPRRAVASGIIIMSADAMAAIRAGNAPKGDVLGTARIAGIMAAKRTGDLIPLCHPLGLEAVNVDFSYEDAKGASAIRVTATASLTGRTGVEMEAMTAASIALLTIYDMAKAIDKGMVISQVRLIEKTGGKSGDWKVDAVLSELLGLEEAQARLLALAPVLRLESVPVAAMSGRYLAEDIRAARTQPPADLSAMDGYALAPGHGPWTLVGESRAGAPFGGTVGAGECVRISTGAIVPPGATCVLLQEDAARAGNSVTATERPAPGRHIRARGFDFTTGDLLLTRGTRLTAGRIALVLAAGHRQATTVRPVRVAVMDSGDELSADPANCAPHQIPASNGAMIAAMLAPLGCEVLRLGPVRDDMAALAAALAEAESADIVITSGGASVGDHDLIKPALADWGAQTAFWKVAIKPGKPLLVATRGAQVILGLPGNPVSSFVTAFLFALPLVRAALGDPAPLPRSITLPAGQPLPVVGKRREFLRAVTDGQTVQLAGSQDSSALTALAAANCLIDRAAGAAAVVTGEPLPVFHLRNG